jgi:queuine/archaeosine tRNA-ribosyltransferase
MTNRSIDDIFRSLESDIAFQLDKMVYLPTKQELAEKNITHSLGFRKENFKAELERLMIIAKREITELSCGRNKQ